MGAFILRITVLNIVECLTLPTFVAISQTVCAWHTVDTSICD